MSLQWALSGRGTVIVAGRSTSSFGPMKRHYAGLTERMLSEIESISAQMSHQGEKGRNNEAIIAEFLNRHLPTRYTVSTGKVVGVGGTQSGQMDLIVHDRLETPSFIDAHQWSLVPIESVYAVISVKTTLTRGELRDAMASIESVRSLPRIAATILVNNKPVQVPESAVLRPRGLVFAFKSGWTSFEGCRAAFVELLAEIADDNRPNAVCVLDQGFMVRAPYTTNALTYADHALIHFLVFLGKTIDNRPRYRADMAQYFSEDYGQKSGA